MKKIYLKPEIEEVTIFSMQMLNASQRIDFKIEQGSEENEDDEVDDFDLLL
jgi:hypothetical protein